jgi:tetratricopeptide (TPR) repeat protein
MVEEGSVEMDATTAHLDRGWDLVGRGELTLARVSAQHALANDPDSAEGHTLLGAIAAAEGDAEEAVELFRQALDADPEHVDALLYAAELAIHQLGRVEYALQLCDDAEELLAGSREAVEVAILRAEAYLVAGKIERAAAELDRLPEPPYPDATQHLRVGRALLDVERPKQAAEHLQRAVDHPSCGLDALYFLGVAEELLGDYRGALRRFLAVYESDRALSPPAWSISAEAFSELVRELIARFPEPIVGKLRAAELQVRQYPPMELVAEGFDPRAAAFFAGPWSEPDGDTPGRRGAKHRIRKVAAREQTLSAIFLYKANVERFAGSAEGVVDELLHALISEVAFFFGLEPDDLQELVSAAGA